MDIRELQDVYAAHPNTKALAAQLENSSVKTIFLGGLHASASPLFFSSYLRKSVQVVVFILNDLEEAGYFYHDLIQINGEENILFFPSSYRRAIKYGQKDAANEILRTEVLSRLQKGDVITVVTYPEALAEKVVSHQELSSRTLKLDVGQQIEVDSIMDTVFSYQETVVTLKSLGLNSNWDLAYAVILTTDILKSEGIEDEEIFGMVPEFLADKNIAAKALYEKCGYRFLRQKDNGRYMIKQLP